MSDKDLTIQTTDITATLDFTSMYDKAVTIFAEQAMIGTNSDDIDIKALQLSKAKSENFLNAVAGMLELAHKVDLLAAAKDKFKRTDELKILNSLRKQFEKSAEYSEKLLDSCMGQLDFLLKEMETGILDTENIEKLSMMQGIVARAIENLNNISTGTTKLIKSERETGGRSSGISTNGASLNVTNFLENFSKTKENTDGKSPLPEGVVPRKLDLSELTKIVESETPARGRPRKIGSVATLDIDFDDED